VSFPQDTSTDTDAFSDVPSFDQVEQARRAMTRRVILLTIASVALAAASVEAVLFGSGMSTFALGKDSFVSGAGENIAEKSENTGCGNWRRISYSKPITTKDEDACVQACLEQPGCVYANFQDNHPGTDECLPKYQSHLGACYQFGEECIKSNNPCWNLIKPKADQLKPAIFKLEGEATGCENWDQAKIGGVHMVWNKYECSNLCSDEAGCIQFGFQHANASVNDTEQVGAGACYLFSRVCQQEENKHWDLFTMTGPIKTTASTTAGVTTTTAA
jgi:hypothetical protein